MSVCYYLACDDCEEVVRAASQTFGPRRLLRGYDHFLDSSETLPPFIIAHSEHRTRIVQEYSGQYLLWTEDNVDGLVWEAQEDNRL